MTMKLIAGGVFLFICSPLFLVLFSLFRNSPKKEQGTVDHTVSELIPISYYDTEEEAYRLSDGTYCNLFKINTKDIYSASKEEQAWDDMKFAKLYQTFTGEIKYIVLNFPINTLRQQEYWRHKIETTRNLILKKQQEEKLFQLEWLQSNSTAREFYMVYYSKDSESFKKDTNDILITLGSGRDGLLEVMSAEKKHQILYKMANKSSQIFNSKEMN